MAYKKMKLFYGGAKRSTWCEFYDGPALMAADSLQAGGLMNVKEYKVGNGSFSHTLKFKGKDSPDFYGISLESDNGVMVDNIALRGSSGTFFYQINNSQLKQFYEYLNVKLIILQFGGNALPAIENAEKAANFANYIKYQISLVKKMAPDASIIFIGPSDMSIKVGTDYVTYPHLEALRNELRRVVLESDCAFFDLYDCMGGKNSMPGWVEQRLAATDYTHFSPQGARKIATLFYSELIKEYNLYLKTKN
jgi:lysophospholipase L1-like esterase